MTKTSKKQKKKTKCNMKSFFIVFLCLIINGFVIYYLSDIFVDVYNKQQEKALLVEELEKLKDTGESLKVEVTKLSDSEYVAKYAREKYLYSADGEYIIRIK